MGLPTIEINQEIACKCVTEEFVGSQNSCQGDPHVISGNAGLENDCKLVNWNLVDWIVSCVEKACVNGMGIVSPRPVRAAQELRAGAVIPALPGEDVDWLWEGAASPCKRAALCRSETRRPEEHHVYSKGVLFKSWPLHLQMMHPGRVSHFYKVLFPLLHKAGADYNVVTGMFWGLNEIMCKNLFLCSHGHGKARGSSHAHIQW